MCLVSRAGSTGHVPHSTQNGIEFVGGRHSSTRILRNSDRSPHLVCGTCCYCPQLDYNLGDFRCSRHSENFALGAFTVFRITAVLAMLWLAAEIVEGFSGRSSFGRVLIDGLLTLPMFVFWFLVAVSTG